MTGEPLSVMQRWRIGQLRNMNRELFVLDNDRNVARCIVILADDPQRLDKIYISAGGKIVGRFTYRRVQDPVSTVAQDVQAAPQADHARPNARDSTIGF